MAAEPDLDPGVRIPFADHRLVEDRIVVTGGVSGGQPGRDAKAAEHQRLGGGELLAVAGLDVEEEPVHGIATRGHRRKRERVGVGVLEVTGYGHHRVELVGRARGHSRRELTRGDRQCAEVLIRA